MCDLRSERKGVQKFKCKSAWTVETSSQRNNQQWWMTSLIVRFTWPVHLLVVAEPPAKVKYVNLVFHEPRLGNSNWRLFENDPSPSDVNLHTFRSKTRISKFRPRQTLSLYLLNGSISLFLPASLSHLRTSLPSNSQLQTDFIAANHIYGFLCSASRFLFTALRL